MAEKEEKKAAPRKKAAAVKKTAAARKTAAKKVVARPVKRTVPAAERPREERRQRPAPAAPRAKREPRPLPTAPAGEVPLIAADGSVSGTLALPRALAEVKKRAGVLFQALDVAASNAHLGTAATKNRARVSGGGAKPWRQKGTGRARQGSTRAPHWRHGGVVFGPNGRRYDRRIPEKMRREAFAQAFAARAGEGRVLAFENLSFDERPRTRAVVEWLTKIGDTGSVLIVMPQLDEATARAAANAERVGVRSVGALRTADMLTHDTIVVRRDALEPLAARAALNGGAA